MNGVKYELRHFNSKLIEILSNFQNAQSLNFKAPFIGPANLKCPHQQAAGLTLHHALIHINDVITMKGRTKFNQDSKLSNISSIVLTTI